MERRLTAILISDIVGYTKLMEEDTEGTVAAWSDARDNVVEPQIESASGRLVKFMGDGFLAEFGTVQTALECAIAIQNGVESNSLNFRMAVHMGDIIDDGKDIYGEGINIASRLEGIAEPGGICISGDVYNQVRNRITAEYEDIGPQEVKNVAEPVQAYSVRFENLKKEQGAPAELKKKEKPSIAVLPFNNMSADPEQEYFSDGITEDIITALSHLRWLNVIARNSSFSYKGQSPDIRKVSEELNCRYVLEGSIQKAGARVRINAQLLEGESGNHIWAEKYDRNLEDIFELQDEITLSVLGAIEPSLRSAEIERSKRKPPDSLDAYDLCLRAISSMYSFNPSDNSKALDLFHKAIELEPDYAEALAYASWGYEQRFNRGWDQYSDDDIGSGADLALRAIRTGSEDPIVLVLSGFVLIMSSADVQLGLLTAKRALKINPNIGFVYMIGGTCLLYSGDNNIEAIKNLELSLSISPRDPTAFALYANLGLAYLENGDPIKAEEYCNKSIELYPSWDTGLQGIITVLVTNRKLEEAKLFLQRLVSVDKSFSIKRFEESTRIGNQSLKSKMVDALRQVGAPET